MAQLTTGTPPDSRVKRVTLGISSSAPGVPMLPSKLAEKTGCPNWGDKHMNMLVAIFTQFQDEEEIELSVHNGQRHGATCASLMVPYSALLDDGLPF